MFSRYEQLSADKKEIFIQANTILKNLSEKLRDQDEPVVLANGNLESKLVWSMRTFLQPQIRRFLEICYATALCWNNDNRIGCVILSRAFFEQTAMLYELNYQIEKRIHEKEAIEIHNFIMNRAFSERAGYEEGSVVEPLVQSESNKAKNVLAFLDRMKKDIPNIKDVYALLSDIVHPNGIGTTYTYSKLCTQTKKTAYYSKLRDEQLEIFFLTMRILPIFEMCVKNFEDFYDAVQKLSELERA